MNDLDKIEQGLMNLIHAIEKSYGQIKNCKVISVDQDAKTCRVTDLIAEIDYVDVRLRSIIDDKDTGIWFIPKVGSFVQVGVINSHIEALVVLTCNEIDKFFLKIGNMSLSMTSNGFVFNEGTKGMVKITDLVTKINRLEDKLKDHQHAYIPYPGGAPGIPVATTAGTLATPPNNTLIFDNTTVDDLEDTKIKH